MDEALRMNKGSFEHTINSNCGTLEILLEKIKVHKLGSPMDDVLRAIHCNNRIAGCVYSLKKMKEYMNN